MSMRQRRRTYQPPPETLADGRYTVLKAIGAGGMAMVYRVRDEQTGEMHAAKLLNEVGSARDKTRQRFLNEARTMQRLEHPHIVRIHDVGEQEGLFYFVMELASRGPLANELKKFGVLEARRALRISFETLSGLAHAHAHKIVHRDMKPQNILLSEEGRVKLTDFGIARVVSDEGQRITATGDMLGTIAYMAPEQRLDPRRVGPTADIYSVGATLYIALTGRRPVDLAMARIDASVMERVPLAVRPVIRRAVAQRAEDRYQTAEAMARDVAESLAYVDETLDPRALMASFAAPQIPVEPDAVELQMPTSSDGNGPSFKF